MAALLAGCGTTTHRPAGPGHRSSPTTGHARTPQQTVASATTSVPGTTSAPGTVSATASTSSDTTTSAGASGPSRPARHRNRVLLRIRRVGWLPQTMTLPSPDTRVFHAEMQALWTAVRRDRPALGLPAFFPADAYVQVKTIYDPRGDWQARLVGDFNLDVGAAHALLGSRPSAARLLRVSVPMADAHWIPPGVCDNRVGYYEVPNARMVYSLGGSVHSFGIASMISWRRLWFVVHLGAILRSTDTGQVDDPSAGPGVSVPSSTC